MAEDFSRLGERVFVATYAVGASGWVWRFGSELGFVTGHGRIVSVLADCLVLADLVWCEAPGCQYCIVK